MKRRRIALATLAGILALAVPGAPAAPPPLAPPAGPLYLVTPPPGMDLTALAARPRPPKAWEGKRRLGAAPECEYAAHLPENYYEFEYRPMLVALHAPRGYALSEYEAWRPLLLERPYCFAAPQTFDHGAGRSMDPGTLARLSELFLELRNFHAADTGTILLAAPATALDQAAALVTAFPDIRHVGLDATGEEPDRMFGSTAEVAALPGSLFAAFAGRTVEVACPPGAERDPATPAGALVARLAAAGAKAAPAGPGREGPLAARARLLRRFEAATARRH